MNRRRAAAFLKRFIPGLAGDPPDLPPMYPGGMRLGIEEEHAVLEVLRNKRLFRYYGPHPGPSKADAFEAAFSATIGAPHCVATASGTSALITALSALGIGPGDEVIVPAYTWIASASAVVAVGAVPVVADIDSSLTLDADDVERKLSPYTKAIMPVHMRGAPCHMDRLMDVARRHDLRVLEDVAQAAGGTFRGRSLGTIGDAGAFSFQFNKIITAGEGGMAVTGDAELHRRLLLFHDVGAAQRHGIPSSAELPGLTLRMSELQAAILLVQLGKLDAILTDMRARQRQLRALLASSGVEIELRASHDPEGDTGLCLVFFAESPSRAKAIVAGLRAARIWALVLHDPAQPDYHVYTHWTAIVERRAWSSNGGPWRHHPREVDYSAQACAASLGLLRRAVHIDVSPELTHEQTDYIGNTLVKVLRSAE